MDEEKELEKEFELERVIMFADGVFAIAITLLVIDIKWPDLPGSMTGVNVAHFLRPMSFQFFAYALSFFLIGRSWSMHVRLFRLLRKFDQGLVSRNLLYLFFIATFPFTASGVAGHIRVGFLLPLYLYLGNLTLLSVMNYFLCRYVIFHKPALCVPGEEGQKRYLYARSRFMAFGLGGSFALTVALAWVFPGHPKYIAAGFIFGFAAMRWANQRAKRSQARVQDRPAT